ncbi:ABC transporter ATP-binding protein [Candidatus Nephthysia bennettiae]|uniref:ABC transporter ATP-binding protein n=1 Tax=Candidatus Nephthysia bennettiae TaxID=3127016 RepID=A0A934K7M4_9BACT|nr:ABC transporter ATP-binding protein [Candidatus Dormibacteraeota bacterium]
MAYFHFRRREGGNASPQSGLSGPADIPEPQSEQPRDIRSRLRSFRQALSGTLAALPRVLRLVWEASPALTIGLAVATVFAGIVPAATAYTTRLLINAVVAGYTHRSQPEVLSVALPFHTFQSPPMTPIAAIVALSVVQFLIYAISSGLTTLRNVSQQLMQERVTLTIQLLVMEHAARLDLPFFEESASYDLLRRAQTDAANRPVAMISTTFGLLQTAITFASMIALLLFLSPLLALVALVSPIPAFINDTRYGWRGYNVARWASPLRRRMQYLTTLVTTDTFAKEVKLFGLGEYFIRRFRMLANTYYDRQRRLVTTRYLLGSLWGLLTTLAGSITYFYVALQAVAGRLTIGDLTLYTSAASSVQSSIQGLLGGFSSMYEHNLYLSNLYELLATPTGVQAPEHPRTLPMPVRGEVVFENVSFSYPGSGAQALENVSFRIPPGQTLAVVGRNGAGKSTLIKLMCRLYDPTGGRILLDGIDIRDLDPEELRTNVAAMFQDYVTYQATAAENIGLGDLPELENRLAVEVAAERGGADELVEKLPAGYETPLGKWFDHGANLSGGEWQKIALSRAFMRRAPILVLDEPTSALDAQAEYELFERLRELSRDRTAVYISHRFSTVRQADRILFLEGGRLVEEGTHEELMELGGRYAALFNLQASAYLGEEAVAAP